MSQKGFMANPLRSAGDDVVAQSLPYGGAAAATASSIGRVNYFRHHVFD